MENIVRLTPGPTQYVISCVDDSKSAANSFTRVHGGNYAGYDKAGGESCVWGHMESIGPGRLPSLHGSVDSGWDIIHTWCGW